MRFNASADYNGPKNHPLTCTIRILRAHLGKAGVASFVDVHYVKWLWRKRIHLMAKTKVTTQSQSSDGLHASDPSIPVARLQDADSFAVKAWYNGKSAYGIRISPRDRDEHFDPTWEEVRVTLPNGEVVVANVDKESFWKRCPELISVSFGAWLKAEKLAPWPKSSPPQFMITPTGEAVFKLRAMTNLERYEALAREHGADLSEEGFNEALRKVSRRSE